MYTQTIIILAAMLAIFIAGSFFRKVPMALFLVLAAIVGALIGGFGTLEIAVNQGNAHKTLRIPVGHTVEVTVER